jgi:hypothetical protein
MSLDNWAGVQPHHLIRSLASLNWFRIPLLVHHRVTPATPSFSVSGRSTSNVPFSWNWFLVSWYEGIVADYIDRYSIRYSPSGIPCHILSTSQPVEWVLQWWQTNQAAVPLAHLACDYLPIPAEVDTECTFSDILRLRRWGMKGNTFIHTLPEKACRGEREAMTT